MSIFPESAFPYDFDGLGISRGVSLRDYFAARAVPAVMTLMYVKGEQLDLALVADFAYAQADALLAHREKKA